MPGKTGGSRLAPEPVLIAATLLWGSSFLVTRVALAAGPPLAFVALRFGCAALLLLPLARPHHLRPVERRGGLAIGLAMLVGYSLLAESLTRIASGRAAFLTALYVPGVPLLHAALSRSLPSARALGGACLASAGLMLLAGPLGSGGFGLGEAAALGAAASATTEIVLVGRFARHCDPRRLALLQCATVAVLAGGLSLAAGEAWPARPWPWAAAGLGLGCASVLMQLAANWAMRTVSPSRAALIYALEPVWAGVLGIAAGERLGAAQLAGAALIVGAMVTGRGTARVEATLGG